MLEFRFVVQEGPREPRWEETPAERASRLVEKMRGLLKKEIDAHGGAEAFIRWVRADTDEGAA